MCVIVLLTLLHGITEVCCNCRTAKTPEKKSASRGRSRQRKTKKAKSDSDDEESTFISLLSDGFILFCCYWYFTALCVQCFDSVGWVTGRASGP